MQHTYLGCNKCETRNNLNRMPLILLLRKNR